MATVLDISAMATALGMSDKDVLDGILFSDPVDTPERLVHDYKDPNYTDHSKVELLLLLAAHFVKKT